MALYVNTNVSSLNSQRKLANATNALNVSYQRLSSGLRINSSKDDAAGLQISDRLTAQINGLNQGNRNTNDGIALAQTVEGALDETTNMLQRIRVLAVQSANGTNTAADRKALQQEVTQLCGELDRIGKKTTFACAQILDGKPAAAGAGQPAHNTLLDANGKIFFQVGANANDTLSLDLAKGFSFDGLAAGGKENGADITAPAAGAKVNTLSGLVKTTVDGAADRLVFSVSSASGSQVVLKNIDAYIQYVDSSRAALGALQNRMESTIRNQASIAENESDARSRIRDTDFASETATLTQNNIIQQASQTVLSQANQRPTLALNLLR